MRIESDNAATMAGYTVEYYVTWRDQTYHVSVRPESDLDGYVRAFDHDAQEMTGIAGWGVEWQRVTNG